MHKPGAGVLLVLAGALLLPGCAKKADETPATPPGAPNTAPGGATSPPGPGGAVGEAARDAGQAVENTVRGVGQSIENAALTAKVKNALMLAKGIDTSKLNVDTTKEGVVTLKGSVPTAEMKNLAAKTAKNVAGVTQVKNALMVAASGK